MAEPRISLSASSTTALIHTNSAESHFDRFSVEHLSVEDQDDQAEMFDIQRTAGGRRRPYSNHTTIDWIYDLAKDRVRLKLLRSGTGWHGYLHTVWDSSQAWLLASAVGISAGLWAAFIDISSEWLNDLKSGFCGIWYLNRKFCCWQQEGNCPHWTTWHSLPDSSLGAWFFEYIMYIMMAVVFTTISAILVREIAPLAAGSGIPDVKTILSGFIIRQFLGFRTLLIKSIGLSLSVASGLALGKEGPLVHVACCCGNIFSRFFDKYANNEAKRREILSAAAAAGVSVAFGAPIGGVLFSLEEVSYYFPYKTLWRAFFSAMTAAVMLQILNPFRTNQLVLFQVTDARPWYAFELPFFVLLGILGGCFGAFFTRLNMRVNGWRKISSVRSYPVFEAISIAVMTSLISYPHPFTRINMSELISMLFRDCELQVNSEICSYDSNIYAILSLLFVACIKGILMTITFGIKVPAGIFIPSLCVGACLGRALGTMVQIIQRNYPAFGLFASCMNQTSCIAPGTYAMVGAASVLAGVTRMTVSLTVIMFELTGALTHVLPFMLAIMVAKLVADSIEHVGIYDQLIVFKEYPYLDRKDEYSALTKGCDIMTPASSLRVLYGTGMTLNDVEDKLRHSNVNGFPVILGPKQDFVVGFIGKNELQYCINNIRQRENCTGQEHCFFIPRPPNRSLCSVRVNSTDKGTNSTHDILLSTAVGMELNIYSKSARHVGNSATSPLIDFRQWVDPTPVTVHFQTAVEIILELFQKLGLRYILLVEKGRLKGIITKKDLLRHLQNQ